MVCTVRGKRSYFCMGRAQSIQCAVTQHSRAVGCHHMCPVLTDTHLVNPTIKPSVGYPVGSYKKLVLLPAEPTIQGGCLLFKLALCYCLRSCSK